MPFVFQIVVMTPQILLDALRLAFLTMSAVSLLIFDECHRACGSHPYVRIMKVIEIWGSVFCFDNIGR